MLDRDQQFTQEEMSFLRAIRLRVMLANVAGFTTFAAIIGAIAFILFTF